MASVQPRTIRVDGRPARIWRGGTGQALLLIHGGLGDAYQHWHWVWEQLGDTFTVVAPDLPGFGETAHLPAASFPAYVDWLGGLLETIGFPRAALVGNSFGATVTRLFAASRPFRVTRLVLVNGGRVPEVPRWAAKFIASPALGQVLLEWVRRVAYSRIVLKRLVADERYLTTEFVERAARDSKTFVTLMRELALAGTPTHLPASAANPDGAVRGETCPTLIIWGSADRLASAVRGRKLAEELPGSRLLVLARAGHMPQMEAPAEFIRAVRDFCRGR